MKPLLLILALALPISAQTLVYDKFTDSDSYQSKHIEVYRNKGGLLVYSPARVQMQAIKPVRRPDVSLYLTVDSYDWQFIRSCTISILADTKRFHFPCEVVSSDAHALRRSVYVQELVSAAIPAAEYKTIFESKSVEMRVGVYEFKLKDKHLKELRWVIVDEITTTP